MDNKTTYLVELFYSQVERENFREASSLLRLLTPHLPPNRIKHLQSEIPDRRKAKCPSQAKQAPVSPRSKYISKSELAEHPSISQDREEEIRAIVNAQEIKYLVHFTQACNVASILRYGLVPRKRLPAKLGCNCKDVRVNDQMRYDGHSDASCLSISFPNYQMFFRYRQNLENIAWAVLLISPKVLWEKDCAFYSDNAASWNLSHIPVKQLKSVADFKALFDDYVDGTICVDRSRLGLRSFYTTNPQAEVLIFDIIPPQDFIAVCLPNFGDTLSKYRADWQRIDIRIAPAYFGPRNDHEIWTNLKKQVL